MSNKSEKKLLENPIIGSMVVPVAIVLVGALIIFGVTKILSTERDYKDLVREMHSKTFGNRWVAAYELSKLISSSQIPGDDVPWLIENLNEIYTEASDPRTRQFCVVAMGAMRSNLAVPYLMKSLYDSDSKVRFHGIVSLGNTPAPLPVSDWSKPIEFLSDKDAGIVQAAILALATHRVVGAESGIVKLLTHPNQKISFSAALALINFKKTEALDVLREIIFFSGQDDWDASQLVALKLNVFDALAKNKWTALNSELNKISEDKLNLTLAAKAREVLNILKK
jgi:hypothetical protein